MPIGRPLCRKQPSSSGQSKTNFWPTATSNKSILPSPRLDGQNLKAATQRVSKQYKAFFAWSSIVRCMIRSVAGLKIQRCHLPHLSYIYQSYSIVLFLEGLMLGWLQMVRIVIFAHRCSWSCKSLTKPGSSTLCTRSALKPSWAPNRIQMPQTEDVNWNQQQCWHRIK